MKHFTVEVKQVKTLYFNLNAKNKRKAKQMIYNLFSNIDLDNLYLEQFKLKNVEFVISKLKNKQDGDENMAYVKRVPPIKLILTIKEYNTLIGVLTKNIDEFHDTENEEIAILTKEKLLKFSIPHENDLNVVEIDVRLYLNEAADIMTQLLSYIAKRTNEIDYYQVLLKVRESFENQKDD